MKTFPSVYRLKDLEATLGKWQLKQNISGVMDACELPHALPEGNADPR
jgi:hypothetical protein